MSAEPPKPMQLSPDGRYYWAGTGWAPTLSPSGRWLWDGKQWRPVEGPGLPSPRPGPQTAPSPHPQPQNSVQYASPLLIYRPPTNSAAVVSLVAGIVSWFLCPLVGGIVAVISGHMAHSQIKSSGEGGAGMATAGLALGYIHLAAAAVFVLVWLVLLGGLAALFGAGAATSH